MLKQIAAVAGSLAVQLAAIGVVYRSLGLSERATTFLGAVSLLAALAIIGGLSVWATR